MYELIKKINITQFQFHKGAIRTRMTVPQIRLASNFNSIKVRLERTVQRSFESSGRFQFHKGAIRTCIR